MKTKLLAMVVACMSVLTASAQETDLKKYLQVKDSEFKTLLSYDKDFTCHEEYMGEGYRCGLQSMTYTFIGVRPEEGFSQISIGTPTSIITLTDMYGTEHARGDMSQNISNTVNKFLKGYSKSFSSVINHSFTISRGGVYAIRHNMDFIDYDWRDIITICDDPTLRILGSSVVKTGEDASFKAFYNTGYPFDVNSLTGEEKAKIKVYKHLSDSTSTEIYSSEFQLNLKDEAHPLIAGIDSIPLIFEKPELGAYTICFESNWDAIDDRNVSMSVQDTLRASVSLDKQAYVLDKDNKARLGIKMDYGYPHIYAVEPDTIPTIRISAVIMQEADTLLYDSLKLVSDTLQIKDLLYDKTWEVDLTKIDRSKLKDAQKQLYFTIQFNGAQQYSAVLPVSIQPTATDINRVTTTGEDEEAVYTLSGMRINPKGKLPAGVYIRNGKKIVVKQ